jgi:hypothetical protein
VTDSEIVAFVANHFEDEEDWRVKIQSNRKTESLVIRNRAIRNVVAKSAISEKVHDDDEFRTFLASKKWKTNNEISIRICYMIEINSCQQFKL